MFVIVDVVLATAWLIGERDEIEESEEGDLDIFCDLLGTAISYVEDLVGTSNLLGNRLISWSSARLAGDDGDRLQWATG